MIWVLVDVSWLAYRAYHSVGDLELDDVPTGTVFGVFNQLRSVCLDARVRSNRVAIFCDSRRSIRRESQPDYKEKRRDDRSEEEVRKIRAMRVQLNLLTERVLPECGFPVFHQDGLESDDLMAAAARELSDAGRAAGDVGRRAVMVTADGDLLQCLTRWVHWYDPQRQLYHDPRSFREKYGLSPRRWGEVKTIAGCKSDNVRGVPGVGETTAIKFLRGELPAKFKAHQNIVSPRGARIAAKNRGLVVLPHAATEWTGLREPVYDASRFFWYCRRYGLLSILRDRAAWRTFLGGAGFKTRKRGE